MENKDQHINDYLPVGVFDSGIGGLSIVKPLLDSIAANHIIYVADTAYSPYGELLEKDVIDRSKKIIQLLINQGAKSIVVACNTATAIAVDSLREKFDLPIVAMEPAIKPAMQISKTDTVAVLATAGTLASQRYAKLEEQHVNKGRVISCICHGWVQQVESGNIHSEETKQIVKEALSPLLKTQTDVLVLGCTHYPFLEEVILDVINKEVKIINPAPAVVEQLLRVIHFDKNEIKMDNDDAVLNVWVSHDDKNYKEKIAKLIGHDVELKTFEF